jgi:hypothetical protein
VVLFPEFRLTPHTHTPPFHARVVGTPDTESFPQQPAVLSSHPKTELAAKAHRGLSTARRRSCKQNDHLYKVKITMGDVVHAN